MGKRLKGGEQCQRGCRAPVFSAEPLEQRLLLAGSRVWVSTETFGWWEGNTGTTDFVFNIARSRASKSGSVRWRTKDATAKAGSDYIAASGKLTFRPHQSVKHVTVKVLGDTKLEEGEYFRLELYDAVGLKIPRDYKPGEGYIMNDDGDSDAHIQLPTDRFTTVSESDGSVAFTVTKIGNPAKSVSVNYTTAEFPDSPSYTARAGVDYVRTSGTLTLGPGVMSQTIHVPLIDDSIAEADRHFKLRFYDDSPDPSCYNTATSSCTLYTGDPPTYHVQINDDDPPTVSFAVDPYVRLDPLGRPVVRFTAAQPAESSLDAAFEFSTEDGSASADVNYTALHGTMHMDGGSVPRYIDVPVLTSEESSPPRDFNFNITNIVNGIAANTSLTAQIRFDREAPTADSVIVGFIDATNLRANVTVKDNFRMLAGSFQSDAIFLSGPNDYRANCFFRIDANLVDAPQEHIPCDFTAPGGTWNAADDGYYTINVSGNQIEDVAGNRLSAATIGAFQVLGGKLYQS